MFIKLIFFILVAIILGIPLNNKIDLLIVIIAILALLITKKIDTHTILRKKYFLLLCILTLIINNIIPKHFYNEAHQIFINEKDLKVIEEFLPQNILKEIKKNFFLKFDFNRLFKSSDWDESYFTKKNFIKKPYAFSVDNFFINSNYTRSTSSINFSSREDLRIGQINSLTYNFPFDKNLRRILPYYVFFEIPKIAQGSQICSKGNFYFKFENKKINLNDVKNLKFNKILNKECLYFKNEYEYLYVFGYSINLDDNLSINLKENYKILFLKFIKYFLSFGILLYFIYIFFEKKNLYNSSIYFVSAISTLLLFIIRDDNIVNGLRYYRGGADGLLHYSRGRDIIENFTNNNFFLALRGGEDVFYFMPGLRYFSSISNIFFGETSYGYILICTLLPLVIFKIFESLINKKFATVLFISFIFIPIFENMGFGHFNYVWQAARYHAETIAIFLLLVSLYLIISYKNKTKSSINFYFISIFLSLAVILRPNFLPTSFTLFIYSNYIFYKSKNLKLLLFNATGYNLIFLCLFHNYFFGNSFTFFTNASVNFKLNIAMFFDAIYSFFIFNYDNQNFLILKSQFFDWNPLYNIHRILIIIFIVIFLILKKHKMIFYILFFSMLSQHGVLFLTHASSRYAYLAWLLTFIIFICFISKIQFRKK